MTADEGHRKLAAILAADVAGYSRLMADDDRATVRALTEYREVFSERVSSHQGHIVDTAGDSVLATFDSVIEAVQAAVEIQGELAKRNEPLPDHRRMRFRIGVNLGDIIIREDGTVYGDGVNVAARLEGLAQPGGVMVSESAHMQVEGKLGLTLADAGAHEVKNIPKPVRAFRVLEQGVAGSAVRVKPSRRFALGIVAAIVTLMIAGGAWWFIFGAQPGPMLTVDGETTDDPVLAMPSGPAIAVLPFDNLSGDPEQDYFVVGLTEELISGLARFQNFKVIARNSTSKYKGKSVDVRDVGRDLGATYVLEGSVRRDKSTLRITAQLIDAGTGAHVWTDTYERDLSAASIFAVQDDITAQVASIIAGHSGVIARKLVADAAGRRTDDLTSYECVLLAYRYDRVFSQENWAAARACLEKAVVRDPDYAAALGALSFIYGDGHMLELVEKDSSIDFLTEAYRLAVRAVELEPTSAIAQRQLAMAYFYNRELDGFYEAAERALALNPHDPTTLGQLGTFMGFAGDYVRGGPMVHKAFALNPDLPYWYKYTFAGEYYSKGQWEAGRVVMEGLDPAIDDPYLYTWHLAFLGELGQTERATEVFSRLKSIIPDFSIARFRDDWATWNIPVELIERYAASLRKAGVPEEAPKPSRPVIAVLPFDNMSGDPEQEYFADGFTDTLITDLSRLWKLRVIARNSTFTYKGRAVDVRDVRKALGATHVVEGSILRSNNRIRVNVQLIDAVSGEHIWADRFDRPFESIFEVQDDIVRAVIAELDVVLASGEQTRVWRRSTNSPEAYDIFMKARENQIRITRANAVHAQNLFQQALDIDPNFAAARHFLAITHYNQAVAGWSKSPVESLDIAERLFLQAIESDPYFGPAYGHLGVVYLAKLEHEKALEYATRGIEFSPGSANALAYASVIFIYLGMPQRGLDLIEKATELDPVPLAWFDHPKGAARIFLGDYQGAITHYRKCLKALPDYIWCNANIIVPYMELGMVDAARAQAKEVIRINPAFDTETAVQVMRIRDPVNREHWRKLLRQAGLP